MLTRFFLGGSQICFVCLIFSFSGKNLIFLLGNITNILVLIWGSIFLIEERENKEISNVDEDGLLEGDQSNISIYRNVFYAEAFFFQ